MKIAAVICEYNPFHRGHALQYCQIRERCGEDTAIIALMSGNFVQRGEAAIFDKYARAAMAVENGADLVLELPFPYSTSSAERFATAGVHILDALGCVDHLAFGCECAEPEALFELAGQLSAPAFLDACRQADEHTSLGCAQKTEWVFRQVYGDSLLLPLLREPNNLLGVSYLCALLRKKSRIEPLPLPRIGAAYHDTDADADLPSASALRRLLLSGHDGIRQALYKLPPASAAICEREIGAGRLATSRKLEEYILTFYRLIGRETLRCCDSLAGGLSDRIQRVAWENADHTGFFNALRTKKYTDAYLRRALLYGLFDVRSEELLSAPQYTQLLGTSEVGQALLSRTRRTRKIAVLTKPADYRHLPPEASRQAERTFRADSLFCALFADPVAPSDMMRHAPYRKEGQSMTRR